MTYDDLIKNKLRSAQECGFEPFPFKAPLFDWQKEVASWAIRKGRAALFEDCGLGKTIQQLEWADQVSKFTGKPVLILCPLAVAAQTVDEGKHWGIDVTQIRESPQFTGNGVFITNYERISGMMDIIPKLAGELW